MMKGAVILFVLASTFSKAWAADGDAVLTGYLVTGTTCLDAAGTGVATPADFTEGNLDGTCIRLLVEETGTASEYLVKKSDAQGEILVLTNSIAPSYDGTGTAIQFSDGTVNLLDPVTTLTTITTSGSPVRIQLAGEAGNTDACLTDTPDYKDAACGPVEWYFIEACQVSDCATCNADVTLCDACTAGTHVLSGDQMTCQVCDSAITDCTDCDDSTDPVTCNTCGNSKVPSTDKETCVTCAQGQAANADGTMCVDCSDSVTDCTACDSPGVCQTCGNSKVPSTDETKCVTCGVTSCDTCSADGVCDVCTGNLLPKGDGSGCFDCSSVASCAKCESAGQCSACSGGMVLNTDGDACVACSQGETASTDGTMCVDCSGVTDCDSCSADGECGECTGSLLPNDDASACYDCSAITNCEKCKADGECSACSSGLAPNSDGDACEATTTAETTTSDAGKHAVSLLAIVGMALLTMA